MIVLIVYFIIGNNLVKYAMYHLICALLILEYHNDIRNAVPSEKVKFCADFRYFT
jgi:hypothetical protein